MTLWYQACSIIPRDKKSFSTVLYVLKSGYSGFLFRVCQFSCMFSGVWCFQFATRRTKVPLFRWFLHSCKRLTFKTCCLYCVAAFSGVLWNIVQSDLLRGLLRRLSLSLDSTIRSDENKSNQCKVSLEKFFCIFSCTLYLKVPKKHTSAYSGLL